MNVTTELDPNGGPADDVVQLWTSVELVVVECDAIATPIGIQANDVRESVSRRNCEVTQLTVRLIVQVWIR